MTDKIKLEGFNVEISNIEGKYIARVIELPGCNAQGNNRAEAIQNTIKAIDIYIRLWVKENNKRKKPPVGVTRIKGKSGRVLKN